MTLPRLALTDPRRTTVSPILNCSVARLFPDRGTAAERATVEGDLTVTFRNRGSDEGQIHHGPDARERQPMRPRCRRPEGYTIVVPGRSRELVLASGRPEARFVQIKCSKCGQLIEVTDIIESNNGHLSHIDCKRPQVLTPEERALVFVYCSGHVVARCPGL